MLESSDTLEQAPPFKYVFLLTNGELHRAKLWLSNR